MVSLNHIEAPFLTAKPLQGGAPSGYKLVIKAINYRYITNKNHSYWSYVHQRSVLERGHHLVVKAHENLSACKALREAKAPETPS